MKHDIWMWGHAYKCSIRCSVKMVNPSFHVNCSGRRIASRDLMGKAFKDILYMMDCHTGVLSKWRYSIHIRHYSDFITNGNISTAMWNTKIQSTNVCTKTLNFFMSNIAFYLLNIIIMHTDIILILIFSRFISSSSGIVYNMQNILNCFT